MDRHRPAIPSPSEAALSLFAHAGPLDVALSMLDIMPHRRITSCVRRMLPMNVTNLLILCFIYMHARPWILGCGLRGSRVRLAGDDFQTRLPGDKPHPVIVIRNCKVTGGSLCISLSHSSAPLAFWLSPLCHTEQQYARQYHPHVLRKLQNQREKRSTRSTGQER